MASVRRRRNAAGRYVLAYPTRAGERFRGSIVGGQDFETLEAARKRLSRMSAARRRALVVRDLETGDEYPAEARRNPAATLDQRLGTSIVTGRAVAGATRRRNPPLPVRTFTGKSGHLVSEHVLAIDYRHASSAKRAAYRHDFGEGVELWALRDGSLLLRGGHGQRLWEDFFVSDSE